MFNVLIQLLESRKIFCPVLICDTLQVLPVDDCQILIQGKLCFVLLASGTTQIAPLSRTHDKEHEYQLSLICQMTAFGSLRMKRTLLRRLLLRN